MSAKKCFWMLAASLFMIGCSSNEPAVVTPDEGQEQQPTNTDIVSLKPMAVSADESQIISGQLSLTLQIVESAIDEQEQNFAFAPASLYTCYAMLANGAGSDAQQTIARALGANDITSLNAFANRILNELPLTESDVQMNSANALFCKPTLAVNNAFSETLANVFYSPTTSFDNVSTVEQWMSKNTDGLIASLPDEAKGSNIYLMNTLLLKAGWNMPFSQGSTLEENFTAADGSTSTVSMMHNQYTNRVKVGDNYDAMKLTLGELAQFEMVIVRPAENHPLKSLDCAALLEAISDNGWSNQLVKIGLPKFSITAKSDKGILKNTSAQSVIDIRDFSGISAQLKDADMQILGQTLLEIDEDGLTGAACNAGFIITSPGEPVDAYSFICNRPFIYIVKDKNTGIPVFAGYISKL